MDEWPLGLLLVVVGGLLGLQALFCASEIAFFATGPVKARRFAQRGTRGGGALVRLLENRSALLTSILVVITGVLSVSEALLTHRLVLLMPEYGHWIALFGLTAIVVLFVEVTPAVIASKDPERVSLTLAPFVLIVHRALYVVAAPLGLVARGILWLFGVRHRRPTVTHDEIISMIDESEVGDTEKHMLRSAITFADRTVSEVMVPRGDVVCVEESDSVATAAAKMVAEKHSRLPVYREQRDHVVGIVYSKDLLPVLKEGQADRAIGEFVRPAYHVPETMEVAELLAEFQAQRRLMAIAVDEFGATAGVVTLEDVLEEVVGEILDEYDDAEPPDAVEESEGVYLVSGQAHIHELNRDYDLDLPEDGFETIAGLVNSLLGRLPEGGERVKLGEGHLEIEVLEVVARRVARARLIRRVAGSTEGSEVAPTA